MIRSILSNMEEAEWFVLALSSVAGLLWSMAALFMFVDWSLAPTSSFWERLFYTLLLWPVLAAMETNRLLPGPPSLFLVFGYGIVGGVIGSVPLVWYLRRVA